jgi:hypothetical protein
MLRPIIITAFLTCACHTSGHAADSVQLDGLALLKAFSGKTIQGNYADGVQFTETYHPGVQITYQDDRESDTGNWFERNGLFCTFYVKGDGACFAIIKSGTNCYEMYVRENEDGTPSDLNGNWNSVGWDTSRPSTCDLSDKIV